MDVCSLLLLLRGMGRLDDQDGLDEEEERGRVEERVGRKEDEVVREDAAPNNGDYLE